MSTEQTLAAALRVIGTRLGQIETQLADLRTEPAEPTLVDAAEIARRFSLSRDWVYRHSTQLGAVRIGDGPRARLRFDPLRVAQSLAATAESEPEPEARPRRNGHRTRAVELLPVKGAGA